MLPEGERLFTLKINSVVFTGEVAEDEAIRFKGLGGKEVLGVFEGMLFLYEKADRYQFWMKGMTFSIDILWIKAGVLVDITKDVLPTGILKTYQPRVAVDKVLEVNAGTCARFGIKKGQSICLEGVG